jgi:hypothetical protein
MKRNRRRTVPAAAVGEDLVAAVAEAAASAAAAVADGRVAAVAVAKVAEVAVAATTIKATRVSPESRAGRLPRGEATNRTP